MWFSIAIRDPVRKTLELRAGAECQCRGDPGGCLEYLDYPDSLDYLAARGDMAASIAHPGHSRRLTRRAAAERAWRLGIGARVHADAEPGDQLAAKPAGHGADHDSHG